MLLTDKVRLEAMTLIQLGGLSVSAEEEKWLCSNDDSVSTARQPSAALASLRARLKPRSPDTMNMESKLGRIVSFVVVAVFVFFSAKGCVVTTWSSPKTAEAYVAQGADGRAMTMVLLPEHQTIIWYSDPCGQRTEGVLTRMRGSYGTHYFGPFWHVEGPGISFGYRVYRSGIEPVHMEIQVLEKFVSGGGNSNLADKGDTLYEVLLFGRDTIEFSGTLLKRAAMDNNMVTKLLSHLGGPRPLK